MFFCVIVIFCWVYKLRVKEVKMNGYNKDYLFILIRWEVINVSLVV